MPFIAVQCPYCHSEQTIKRGKTRRGTQRYGCQNTVCAPAGASLQTSTADPEALHRSGTTPALRDNPVVAHGRRSTPIVHHALSTRCPTAVLFAPPRYRPTTLDMRWKLLLRRCPRGIVSEAYRRSTNDAGHPPLGKKTRRAFVGT